jgi:O-antigen ligase/polysaccharide polymerase Wzy-like membrane protein
MPAAPVTEERIARRAGARDLLLPLRGHAWAIPGLIAVALMLVWAVHNGGYDADTWYWGSLIMLALLAAVVIARGPRAIRLSRAGAVALAAFALYVAWSYLSISWAASAGDALTGSNRALLYLLVFATLLVLPWTVRGALIALLAFTLGVGVIGVALLVRLASGDHVDALVIAGRLSAPTGYFNSTAALFTIEALVAIALAARRELPGLLRGALIGFACAGLQLAVIVQSRGWLFTLPLVLVFAIAIVPDRVRVAGAAVIPALATLAIVHRLLDVYEASGGSALTHAASQAGHAALLLCGLAFVAATLIAWGESLMPARPPNRARRRVLGGVAIALAAGAVIAGGLAVSHGHPFSFISRQWHGFSHQENSSPGARTGSHFTDVGSGRYDFWRVSLDAFTAHPIGGLGQDNFAEYYVGHRHTGEEPAWTHSLELRLLAHTGLVGIAVFAVFLVAGILAAMRSRRRGGLEAAVAGAALLPLVVWLVHGSVDWFWEIPALTGPALGFLAVAAALGARSPAGFADGRSGIADGESGVADGGPGVADGGPGVADGGPGVADGGPGAPDATPTDTPADAPRRRRIGVLAAAGGVLALAAAVVVLGFPYLSVREISQASDVARTNPAQALNDLSTAEDLNPLSADPDRLAGTIALSSNRLATASQRFQQAISRDPGGWYAWLGAGLAASAQGEKAPARADFDVAARINPGEAVIRRAIDQVGGAHPLTPVAALQLLALSL